VSRITGTRETQRFYNESGWREEGGASVDHNLFGVTEDGPIRIELNNLHQERIRAALTAAGLPLSLLECGCGGNPEKLLLDLCSKYTAVDFSDRGVQMARAAFSNVGIAHEFHTADICALPFDEATFDAIYCAHVIYHIDNPAGQDAAIAELIRVVRPGGVVVLVAANPRPLAFPVRFLRRVLARTPIIAHILNRLRKKPPLPYRPMPIGWVRRRLARYGAVNLVGLGIPSTSFYRNVTEFRGIGKLLWKGVRWLDINYAERSAWLGNYVMFSLVKARPEGQVSAAGFAIAGVDRDSQPDS
jgi:SAM-dependent methyltransferase